MPTVLLVEDDNQLRTMLKLTLIYSGYEVLEAVSGTDIAAIHHQKHPDLVITDLLMPANEGLEVIMDLRREDREAKVLFISRGGHINAESRLFVLAEKLGTYHTLSKPFTTQEFLDAVRLALESSA